MVAKSHTTGAGGVRAQFCPSVPELTPTESSPHPTNQASAHANPSPTFAHYV
jgi:hypothetical protein